MFVNWVISLLLSGTLTGTDNHVLKDTAYIDTPKEIINQAETVKAEGHSFIGPSPLMIAFEASMDQQPYYCSWEIATDNKFEQLIEQFRNTQSEGTVSKLNYTFEESGVYYVRFVADFQPNNKNEGQYDYVSEMPYQVQITESLLEIPNLITPDQPESKNKTFYVRYKSLVSYEIWIYNRWGQELFHSTDPAEGWDGKYNGKTVPTGAYYYLVKAEGAEGVNYNKKGAINVLKTRRQE